MKVWVCGLATCPRNANPRTAGSCDSYTCLPDNRTFSLHLNYDEFLAVTAICKPRAADVA